MKLQRQIDHLLAQRASEWHQMLQSADAPQRAEFVAWLKASPLHVNEYLEIAYTDRILQHVDGDRRYDVDALLAQIKARAVQPTRRLKWLRPALAACILISAAALPFAYKHFIVQQRFATRVGEQRTIQLTDNSLVTLNTDSDIRVHLNQTERDIELTHGEALFEVAQDAHRPFRVITRTATIQAIGTQFNVYEQADGTRVSVLEGRVKISTPLDMQDLGVGEEADVQRDGTILRNVRPDVLKTVAWRERRLVFSEIPLEEIVREFNRYNPTQRLRLEGIAPGSYHYNGIFDATDPESLADLLAKEPDLLVERQGPDIVIRRRGTPQTLTGTQ
jgi:transmembrane sensor